jgi:hypothetical protein
VISCRRLVFNQRHIRVFNFYTRPNISSKPFRNLLSAFRN